MFEMMLGKCRDLNVCVHREQFPTYQTQDAVSVVKNFLQPNPRRRLGACGDTRSILRHPFLKKVNWEAVLQKRVTPPLKPQTLVFLLVNPAPPGDADDLRRHPSIENIHQEAALEAPLNQEAPLVPEDSFVPEDPLVLEDPLVPEDPLVLEDPLVPETPEEERLEEELRGHVQNITEEDKPQEAAEERLEAFHRQIQLLHTEPNENIYYEYIFCMEMYVWFCALALLVVYFIYVNITKFF
jgi:hypothetical protein